MNVVCYERDLFWTWSIMNGSVTNRSERGLCCVVCFEQVCFEREPQFILQTMKRNGESTHPCRSAVPTASGCDSTPPTRIQTSEQECSDLPATDGCQHRPPGTLPKAVLVEPDRMLSRGRQNMRWHLWHTLSNVFAGRRSFGLLCRTQGENGTGRHPPPALVQLFRGIFFRHFAYTLPARLRREIPR